MIPISCFSLVVRFKDKAKFSNLVLYIFVCVWQSKLQPIGSNQCHVFACKYYRKLVHGHEYVVKILIN